jgi:3-oxoacyl-[acyl-carrier-protein] synthase-3
MHFVHQDGRQVFKYAVRQTQELVTALLERNGLRPSDIDLLVCHQANARIIESMREKLGLPEDKVIKNIDRYGNTTAATIPLALWDAQQQGLLEAGDVVVMASVGAGYTSGCALIRWSGLELA